VDELDVLDLVVAWVVGGGAERGEAWASERGGRRSLLEQPGGAPFSSAMARNSSTVSSDIWSSMQCIAKRNSSRSILPPPSASNMLKIVRYSAIRWLVAAYL